MVVRSCHRREFIKLKVTDTAKSLNDLKSFYLSILDQEDPMEKEMATQSSTLAWEIPRTEEPAGLQCMRSQKSWT